MRPGQTLLAPGSVVAVVLSADPDMLRRRVRAAAVGAAAAPPGEVHAAVAAAVAVAVAGRGDAVSGRAEECPGLPLHAPLQRPRRFS